MHNMQIAPYWPPGKGADKKLEREHALCLPVLSFEVANFDL